MAEGGQEEDSGDVMLATATTPTTASSGVAIKRDPDAPLNLKSEVSWPTKGFIYFSFSTWFTWWHTKMSPNKQDIYCSYFLCQYNST
jgi:hypothetical protein